MPVVFNLWLLLRYQSTHPLSHMHKQILKLLKVKAHLNWPGQVWLVYFRLAKGSVTWINSHDHEVLKYRNNWFWFTPKRSCKESDWSFHFLTMDWNKWWVALIELWITLGSHYLVLQNWEKHSAVFCKETSWNIKLLQQLKERECFHWEKTNEQVSK